MEKKYKKHAIVMVLCFLIGGFSIILYLMQAYLVLTGADTYGSFREFREAIEKHQINQTPDTAQFSNFSFRPRPPLRPEMFMLSPVSFMLLFVGIISIAGGLSIFSLVREKEIKSTKEKLSSLLLTPEEKAVIDEIKKARNDITQSQIVMKTGLSKVKVHRVLLKLESKGIIKKHQYGLTNKIFLEKDTV